MSVCKCLPLLLTLTLLVQDGLTALHLASLNDHHLVVLILVAAKAFLDFQTYVSVTYIYYNKFSTLLLLDKNGTEKGNGRREWGSSEFSLYIHLFVSDPFQRV